MTHTTARTLWALSLLFGGLQGPAQTIYGNEWIDYGQSYVRIPVAHTGWYRVLFAELEAVGVPVGAIAPHTYRLFKKGQEIALAVNTSPEGFLEFFGERNDGTGDAQLYPEPEAQPHPFYSLFSDTTAYFLTWNPAVSGKRIGWNRLPDTADRNVPGKTGYWARQVLAEQAEYTAGAIYPMGAGYENGIILTGYDTGEGWTGREQVDGSRQEIGIACPGRMGDTLSLELLLTGRSAGRHRADIWSVVGGTGFRKLGEVQWEAYQSSCFRTRLDPEDLHAQDSLVLAIVFQPDSPTVQRASVGYVQVRYLREPGRVLPAGQELMTLGETGHYELDGELYEVSDPLHPEKVPGSAGGFLLKAGSQVIRVLDPFHPGPLRCVRFTPIAPDTEFLIISHPFLRNPKADVLAEYAAYRSSEAGGGFRTAVVNSWDLYETFHYGEPGPEGLRRAIQWLADKGSLRFVLLAGKAIDPQTARRQGTAWTRNLVPNAGWPGADLPLIPEGSSGEPLVPVGRLQTDSPEAARAYLEKVKAHEASFPGGDWRRRVMHLGGGQTGGERERFRTYLEGFENQLQGREMTIETRLKQTNDPVENLDIVPQVNEGIAMLTLFGHSGVAATDIVLGLASEQGNGLANHGRYPLVIANGCALGNSFFHLPALSTDWIVTPGKGAILFVAHTHNGLEASMQQYTSCLYDVLAAGNFRSRPFGEIQQEAIRRYRSAYPTLTARITAEQMLLQGDPAVRIFPAGESVVPEPGGRTVVYPNPARSEVRFCLEWESGGEGLFWEVIVSDVFGRQVHRQVYPLRKGRNECYWPIAEKRQGIYWYRLRVWEGYTRRELSVSAGKLVLYTGDGN